MIHTVFVGPDSTPATLRKEFRKKLMTGGAVIRLQEDLSQNDFFTIYQNFSPEAEGENACAIVLEQLMLSQEVSSELKALLLSTKIPRVQRAQVS